MKPLDVFNILTSEERFTLNILKSCNTFMHIYQVYKVTLRNHTHKYS
jgi:hypothetical protein